MNGDLISRSALETVLERYYQAPHVHVVGSGISTGIEMGISGCLSLLDKAPAVDAVSRGVFEQVMWERDAAMEQLKEHGIPFGGIAPDVVKVVRCEDCDVPHNRWTGCPNLNGMIPPDNFFCARGKEKRKSNHADFPCDADLEHMTRFAMLQAFKNK